MLLSIHYCHLTRNVAGILLLLHIKYKSTEFIEVVDNVKAIPSDKHVAKE